MEDRSTSAEHGNVLTVERPVAEQSSDAQSAVGGSRTEANGADTQHNRFFRSIIGHAVEPPFARFLQGGEAGNYLEGLEEGERLKVKEIVRRLEEKLPLFSEEQQSAMAEGIAWRLQAVDKDEFLERMGGFPKVGKEVANLPRKIEKMFKITLPEEAQPLFQAVPEFLGGIAEISIAKLGLSGEEAAAIRELFGVLESKVQVEGDILPQAQALVAEATNEAQVVSDLLPEAYTFAQQAAVAAGEPLPDAQALAALVAEATNNDANAERGLPVPLGEPVPAKPGTVVPGAVANPDQADQPAQPDRLTDPFMADNSRWAKFFESPGGKVLRGVGIGLFVSGTVAYVLYFIGLYFATRPGKSGRG